MLRCRFFPAFPSFWEPRHPVSVEVLMHGRALTLTSVLLGRRNLATLVLPVKSVDLRWRDRFLRADRLAIINERSTLRDRCLTHRRNRRPPRNRPV
jgi:hypothetical protein